MSRAALKQREQTFLQLQAARDKAALLESYRRCAIDLQVKAAELSLAAQLMTDQWRAMGGGR